MPRNRSKLRPEGAPALGETYRDWRDFTDRVARPWLDNDGADPQADAWYHTLMLERDPWYLACALVMADNRIRALEAVAKAAADEMAHIAGLELDPTEQAVVDALARLCKFCWRSRTDVMMAEGGWVNGPTKPDNLDADIARLDGGGIGDRKG